MRPELPVLIKARAKIADPLNWGKGVRWGGRNRPLSTCCAAEAIEDLSPFPTNKDIELRMKAYDALKRAAGIQNIVDWNDAPERTHAEVLAAFDKAIADAA